MQAVLPHQSLEAASDLVEEAMDPAIDDAAGTRPPASSSATAAWQVPKGP
jgi:hypothetical protein